MNDEQKTENEAIDIRESVGDSIDFDAQEPDQERLVQLEKELADAKQQTLYAQAETQNVRRRLEAEKQQTSAYAVTNFARDMLSVKDNLDRALASFPEDLRSDDRLKSLITGIEATGRELGNVFQRHGIVRIEAMGQPLDPNRHQAMVEIPNDEAEPGTVVQEMQAGYMIKDRLLRPALVGVARKG
nr:nucleotide exchange factor GrpE [uncultured Sphingosinicella sp.]